jgi:hypothetical protein
MMAVRWLTCTLYPRFRLGLHTGQGCKASMSRSSWLDILTTAVQFASSVQLCKPILHSSDLHFMWEVGTEAPHVDNNVEIVLQRMWYEIRESCKVAIDVPSHEQWSEVNTHVPLCIFVFACNHATTQRVYVTWCVRLLLWQFSAS